jgi:hypothetical protein
LGSYGYVGATLIGISLWLVSSSKQKDPWEVLYTHIHESSNHLIWVRS